MRVKSAGSQAGTDMSGILKSGFKRCTSRKSESLQARF